MGGLLKRAALALAWALVASACADAPLTPAAVEPVATPATEAARAGGEAAQHAVRIRFFVASESADQVWVLEGDPLAVIARIPVGRFPHNLSVSPDGKWVAVANRFGGSASIIDPRAMRELARVMVGKQPHEIIWAPDARTIFVGSEREPFIHRIETDTWKALPPLAAKVPQHDMAIWKDRPNELWFSVTNAETTTSALRVYDLVTNAITQIAVSDVHDVFFTPDGSEAWSSSSGFLCKPSDRMVIYDAVTKKVKQELYFPGRYPFHTMKYNRDATFFSDQTETMVLSDHQQESLMLIDWRERKIAASVSLKDPSLAVTGKCGIQPFHTAYTPGRYYVTTNADNSLRAVDATELRVLYRVEIPTPHGIVFVPLDQ